MSSFLGISRSTTRRRSPKFRIKLTPLNGAADQLNILVNNRRVGYCGNRPGMPVTFLTRSRGQMKLTEEEMDAVVAYVRKTIDGEAEDDEQQSESSDA